MSDSTLSHDLNLQDLFDAPDRNEWLALTEKVLGGAPFEKKLVSKTLEGIAQQPMYDRSALEDLPLADTTPGEFPYLRGTSAGHGPCKAWEICQALPYPAPGDFNQALVHDTGRGQDSIHLAVDPSGHCGTAVRTVAELEQALAGVDLSVLPLHVTAGADAPALAAMLTASDLEPGAGGSVCFDPVALLAVEGNLPMDLDAAGDLLADHVNGVAESLPGFRALGVDVSWNVNAGGNAVYDLALMLASAAETLRMLDARGVSVDTAAGSALVRFAIGSDFFMEIAKFRSARALWAKLVKSCGGGAEAQKLKQAAATSSWNQTRLDPWVNLLRGTSQAFSAVLGGVDILRVTPFDAPFGLPDTFSRRIARNTSLILRDEAHLREVVDPAGGSWTVETLAGELTCRAWTLFQEIEKEGGGIAMLRSGALRERIGELAEKQRTLLTQRRMVRVGSNQYSNTEEKKLPERKPDVSTIPDLPVSEIANPSTFAERVEAFREGASTMSVKAALTGEGVSATPVALGRLTEGYEALRRDMDAHVEANGTRPVAFMAQMGPVKQHKLRSDFSQEFLAPAGFEIDASASFDDPEAAAKAAVARGAAVTVICSTDDTYPDLVPAFARAVKAAAPDMVVVMAGLMPDHTDAFREAGVDDFIHLKANNLQMLNTLHERTGVSA